MKSGIYIYTNKINGKKYVGQSRNIEERLYRHQVNAFKKSSNEYNSLLHRAIRKYGIHNFSIEKIFCLQEEMNDREVELIEKNNSLIPNGYNVQKGGNYTASPNKLSYLALEEITDLLQNSDLTGNQISEKYNVSAKTIAGINTGYYWNRDLNYPIRENKKVKHKCAICSQSITSFSKNGLCASCSQRRRNGNNERPKPLELAKLITETSFSEVGKRFGVSDNAIKKWCKSYGIPHLKKELEIWYQQNKA